MTPSTLDNAHRAALAILILSLLVIGSKGWADDEATDQSPLFETDVTPILKLACFGCHAGENPKAGLDLSSSEGLVSGSESGPIFDAGNPEASRLIELIESGEMPPKKSDRLSTEQVEIIRKWIADGARFRESVDPLGQVTQHRIVPLMLLRCTACHGGRRREAGLDLRTKSAMLKGGKSGPAVVSGQPEKSLIIQRIKAAEMPPRRQLVSVSVKPMEPLELELLETWIRKGLPESPVGPDIATTQPDPLVTNEDRQFWSFQPPRSQKLPSVTNTDRISNPIDHFTLHKIEAAGLTPSREASRSTLVRRVYFDLIGLPPDPSVVEQFVTDNDPAAYDRLVDRLLASPRYGERWGRYWLDAAGYADSEGAQNEDRVRKHFWRYRDYVIRSFNSDKSYDRFLHEQIAGDELEDYENAQTIDEEVYDNLVATGFLRTTPDRTFADITNFVPERLEIIAEEIQVFGSAVLGLTINCARCHSHKFDPIPQRDYYRLAAIFKDAYDEYDWIKSDGPRTLPYVLSTERHLWQQQEQALNEQIESVKKQLESVTSEPDKKTLNEQVKALEGQRKSEPRIRALWSRGEPSPTYVLKRGNYLTPGREVGPGVPSALTDGKTPFSSSTPWPAAKKTGRRLALARWLTEPNHPLTARVMVNRMWQHRFGTGIVKTSDNFGKTGSPPSHPELLDWLALEFVRRGWSIKAMHRLMLLSNVYRQSSRMSPYQIERDPGGRLLLCMPLRRMEGEVLRDSLLTVADRLNLTPFGPPDAIHERADGLVTASVANLGWRRSIYLLQRRTKTPTILDNFDFPQMNPNCVKRTEAIVATQALHLLNNAHVHELATSLAKRVRNVAGDNAAGQIETLYLIVLSRRPTAEERTVGLESLHRMAEAWKAATGEDKHASAVNTIASAHALDNYCHAIINSAAFLYID